MAESMPALVPESLDDIKYQATALAQEISKLWERLPLETLEREKALAPVKKLLLIEEMTDFAKDKTGIQVYFETITNKIEKGVTEHDADTEYRRLVIELLDLKKKMEGCLDVAKL